MLDRDLSMITQIVCSPRLKPTAHSWAAVARGVIANALTEPDFHRDVAQSPS